MKMKKRGLITFVIVLIFLLFLPFLTKASETGCCTNPDAILPYAMCSDTVTAEQCCSGADNFNECKEDKFHEGEDCYEGGIAQFDACKYGCCCVQREDRMVSMVVEKVACAGQFEEGEINRSKCFYDICEVEGDLPVIELEDRQCIYYYYEGDMFPEGPSLDATGANLIYAQGEEGLFVEIDSLIMAGMYTDENYWITTEDGELYLFDRNRDLITSNLEDYGIDENPADIDDFFGGTEYFTSLTADVQREGKIYFTKDNNIYEYSIEESSGNNIANTGQFQGSPSTFNSMSTYASYLYEQYMVMAGYNNKFNFFFPNQADDPFSGLNHIDSVKPLIEFSDAAMEIYSKRFHPAYLFIGSCDTFYGCEVDENCVDFNQCTEGVCLESGLCHFAPKDNMDACADGEGHCCGGRCFTENEIHNNEFHESCRSGPYCDNYFSRYEKENEGEPCAGDCFVCNDGYCDAMDDEECEEGYYCNEYGECVDIAQDQCDFIGQKRCHPNSGGRIQECYEDDESIEGESFLRWGNPEDCPSDICEQATCEEGECVTEFIEEGKEDPDGCYGQEGCTGDEDCKCDGQGECVSFCTSSDECGDDNPCKEWSCNEDGECEYQKLEDTVCFNEDGDFGICDSGECLIQECTETDECQEIPCSDVSCEDNECKYTKAEEGKKCEIGNLIGECSGKGRGENHCEPIGCDPNKEPEEECPSKECNQPFCASEGICKILPDTNEDGQVCDLGKGKEGYCYSGMCVECHEQDHCDEKHCFNNECVECVFPGDCDEDEVCSNNECVIDCTIDESVCQEEEYCNEETSECVECIPEKDQCQENEVCHINKCVDECDGTSDCPSDKVCVDGACVDCNNKDDCKGNFVCDTGNNECVECLDRTDCGEGEHCYNNVCQNNCDNDEDCPGNSKCSSGICLVPCNKDGDCGEDMYCHEEKYVCVECTHDDECQEEGKVCNEEIGKCVDCKEDGDCQGDYFCKEETNECVQCIPGKQHCEDESPCTLNECDTKNNECVESYEEKQGDKCVLGHGGEGFCYEGECVSGCTYDEDCGQGVHDKKEYCYNPSGEEEGGHCVKCYEEDHCERNDEGYECKTVEECYDGECYYNFETGTDCDTCGSTDCVCVEGTCMQKCHPEHNPCTNEDKFCGDDGYCIECLVGNDCGDNECMEYSCRYGICHEEKREDLTSCGDGEGYCCNGECVKDIIGTDFHDDCTTGEKVCKPWGSVEFEYVNQDEVCGDGDCAVCNYGYCDHDNDKLCNKGEDCVEGECHEGCQDKCQPDDTKCMEGDWARLTECTEHPNIDNCYTWNTPEKCPDDKCKEPYCSEGECSKNPISSGQSDEDCWSGFGCEGDICRCDGFGFCVTFECETDNDCEDKELPCMQGNCVDNECEFEPKEDEVNCPGGRCCGGVCRTDIENTHFNESCRSDLPKCVGGSYEYIAENDGDICAGECSVCTGGTCYDNSSMCSDGQECENGECVDCQNRCEEGETKCLDTAVQSCEEINSCMTWGEPKPCDDKGMCTKGDCVDGECISANIERGKTDSECYWIKGCDGNECKCDGEGQCVDASVPLYGTSGEDDTRNGNGVLPETIDDINGEKNRLLGEGYQNLWWLLLLIILMVIVIGGFTGAYYYDANYNQGAFINELKRKLNKLSSKIKSLFSKSAATPKQKMQGSFGPQTQGSQNQPRQSPGRGLPSQGYGSQSQSTSNSGTGQIKSQSPSQAGLAPSTSKPSQGAEPKKLDSALQKELYDYFQTLRQKGPDKSKELELIKKGVTTEKIKELYQTAKKENEKRIEREKKLAKFD